MINFIITYLFYKILPNKNSMTSKVKCTYKSNWNVRYVYLNTMMCFHTNFHHMIHNYEIQALKYSVTFIWPSNVKWVDWNIICDFIFVFNTNVGNTLYRFWDISSNTSQTSKLDFLTLKMTFKVLTPLTLSDSIRFKYAICAWFNKIGQQYCRI